MFVCIATKPLNDRTRGFRFNFFGAKGLVRLRKRKSNGFKSEMGDCMIAQHLGKLTIYLERNSNKAGSRVVRHFAG